MFTSVIIYSMASGFDVGLTAPGATLPSWYHSIPARDRMALRRYAMPGGYPLIVLNGNERIRPFSNAEAKFPSVLERMIMSDTDTKYTINLPINVRRYEMKEAMSIFYPPGEYRIIGGLRVVPPTVDDPALGVFKPVLSTAEEVDNYIAHLKLLTGSDYGFKWVVYDTRFPPPSMIAVELSLPRQFDSGIIEQIMSYLRGPTPAQPSLSRPDAAAIRRAEEAAIRSRIAHSNSAAALYRPGGRGRRSKGRKPSKSKSRERARVKKA